MRFLIVLVVFSWSALGDGLVARVIFAETGPACTTTERLLVASVVKNRIGHKGFDLGRLKTMRDVVSQKGQFESLGHSKNSTWVRSADPSKLKGADVAAWRQSSLLARGKFTTMTREAVYFHDKSISKPKWDNRYWKTYKVAETKHFVFYGVRER
jgi:hypothetical protein